MSRGPNEMPPSYKDSRGQAIVAKPCSVNAIAIGVFEHSDRRVRVFIAAFQNKSNHLTTTRPRSSSSNELPPGGHKRIRKPQFQDGTWFPPGNVLKGILGFPLRDAAVGPRWTGLQRPDVVFRQNKPGQKHGCQDAKRLHKAHCVFNIAPSTASRIFVFALVFPRPLGQNDANKSQRRTSIAPAASLSGYGPASAARRGPPQREALPRGWSHHRHSITINTPTTAFASDEHCWLISGDWA